MGSSPLPVWLAELDDEDREFVRRFVLTSGSLKELADLYGVSYPTIRGRLNQVIEKVKAADAAATTDPFERKVRVLVAAGTIDIFTGKQLLATHRAVVKGDKS